MQVAVIHYNMGNVQSVANAFRILNCDAVITNDPAVIEQSSHIVLPGVGAFGEGMQNIQKLGLEKTLAEQVLVKKKPFLGICLGMQLLAEKGFEFGENAGLGWIPGSVVRLDSKGMPLPHVGWNNLNFVNQSPLTERLKDGADFYFVHSFHFSTQDASHVTASCDYGQTFTAVVGKENIHGAQFHPEKSQKAGRVMLENFLRIA